MGGTFLAMLCILGLFLLSSLSTILLAVVCLYGFWIAIKRSPTPQTRRLMVSAALDVNLVVYALPKILKVTYLVVVFVGTFLLSLYRWINLIPEPSRKNDWLGDLLGRILFAHVFDFAVFILLAGLVLYVVCRWQKLLYEELSPLAAGQPPLAAGLAPRGSGVNSTPEQHGASPVANGHWFIRWRDYFRTDAGLRFKRNFSIALVLLILTSCYGWETWFICTSFSGSSFSFLENTFFFGSIAWFFALYIAIQVAFFKLVSHGLTQAESGAVDFGEWTAEDVSPAKRRQFIKSSLFLFVMVPLLLFALAAGLDIAYTMRNYFWNREVLDHYAIGISNRMFLVIICIGTVLAVLAAFWGTIRPHRRNQIYATLFIGIGTWVFIIVEQAPLMHYEPIRNFLYGWMVGENITDSPKANFFYYHLFAGTCLAVYTALAAWFALRRR